MEDSLWTLTLAGFREKAGGTDPVPAGVAISAVAASLALALLAKVLEITGKRKSFTGDRRQLASLLDAARAESMRLTHLADEDIEAFNRYMACVRGRADIAAASRRAIEVPMSAARCAVRGLELCAQSGGVIQGLTAADLGAAASILAGAVRAMLLSVDSNVREMHSDPEFSAAITAERRRLEIEALRHAKAVAASARTPLG